MGYVRDRRLTLDVLELVGIERDRQERKAIAGDFLWTCADPDVQDYPKLPVLAEELGEVARATMGSGDLREELIHVAAVAVAWAEALTSTRRALPASEGVS